jgi:hypothetical protein
MFRFDGYFVKILYGCYNNITGDKNRRKPYMLSYRSRLFDRSLLSLLRADRLNPNLSRSATLISHTLSRCLDQLISSLFRSLAKR